MEHLLSHHADAECKKMWSTLRLGYTETKGMPLLRQEISALYNNDDLTADNVLCFSGSEESIFCLLRTLLKPGDHAIVVVPCYQSLLSIVEPICSASKLPILPENGWKLDFALLESLIQPGRTKAIITNYPHNPTGVLLTLSEQNQLLSIAAKHDLYIVCDEVYRGLERIPPSEVCFPVAEVYPKGVSLGGLSKAYGLPGLRIGWIASPDRALIDRVGGNKHYLSICNSAPSEVLGLVAVRARHALWFVNAEIVQANLVAFRAFLSRHPDHFSWVEPQGGCCGFVRVQGLRRSLLKCADQLAEQYGILLLPGHNFPSGDSTGHREIMDTHIRVGFGRRNFVAALQKFEEHLPILFA